MVLCPSSCVAEALTALANICPYGATGEAHLNIPEGAQTGYCQHLAPAIVPLLASASAGYDDAVFTALVKANQVYNEFLQSDEGSGFCGEVSVLNMALKFIYGKFCVLGLHIGGCGWRFIGVRRVGSTTIECGIAESFPDVLAFGCR